MKAITIRDLLARFDPSVHGALARVASLPGTEALVVFEVVALDSSHLGECTAVAIGPGRTFSDLESAGKAWLRDLPSTRQYPTGYVQLDEEARSALQAAGETS